MTHFSILNGFAWLLKYFFKAFLCEVLVVGKYCIDPEFFHRDH